MATLIMLASALPTNAASVDTTMLVKSFPLFRSITFFNYRSLRVGMFAIGFLGAACAAFIQETVRYF
ncbi:MAG: hypothetical protein ABTS16_10225 [Candidatus Accumulibacter phosphatis]|uniref:Uncharacterized protein n=1 Tax=Candidatus Accumulibacter contiguus TaxID=2954381 RepID=A0ABX1T481_9PROT|nr:MULTISPECIES: hypothetical protein [Candidatus Accumulibacter]MBL8407728.1 hypothetical protein [Accumulibacter sp.]NMQ04448.1 hypothetical protein [Candidatus Accumulibacter contiguus]